jgi:hypothetical protein
MFRNQTNAIVVVGVLSLALGSEAANARGGGGHDGHDSSGGLVTYGGLGPIIAQRGMRWTPFVGPGGAEIKV